MSLTILLDVNSSGSVVPGFHEHIGGPSFICPLPANSGRPHKGYKTITKVTLNRIGSGYRSSTALNNDFDIIEEGLERSLSRFEEDGNQMESELDMNSHRIINLPEPTEPTDPVRLSDIQEIVDGLATIEESVITAVEAAESAEQDANSAELAKDAAEAAAAAAIAALPNLTFESVAGAASAILPPPINTVVTKGWAAPGDRGGGTYRRTTLDAILRSSEIVDPSGLLVYLPFNGPNGLVASVDLSSYNRPVNRSGQAVISNGRRLFDQNTAYFDGVGDYFGLQDSPDWTFSGDFTIDMWATFEDLAETRLLCAHLTSSSNYYAFYANSDGSLQFRQRVGGVDTINVVSAPAAVVANQMHHLAVIRAGNDIKLYVDRLEVATLTTSVAIGNFNSELRVGSFSTVGHMKGWIGRFRVLQRALFVTGYKVGIGEFGEPAQIAGPPWPQPGVHLLPEQAWFQSFDGSYWVLDEARPCPEQFGAKADANMTTVTGTDDGPSLRALVNYMACKGVPGQLHKFYFCQNELTLTAPNVIYGAGNQVCGIAVAMNAYDTGVRILRTGAGLTKAWISKRAYEARGGGRGDRHCNVTIGDQKFTNGAPEYVDNFILYDIVCHAASAGNTASGAVFVMHSVRGGYIDRITDAGSPRRLTFGFMAHWGATGQGDAFGILESHHNNRFYIGEFQTSRSDQSLVISAPYNVTIKRAVATDCTQGLMLFVGDETSDYAESNLKSRVMTGISIGELIISSLITGTETTAVDITSLGSSTFRRYPSPDAAVGRFRKQQPVLCKIGYLSIVNSPDASKTLLNVFTAMGSIHIDTFQYKDVAGRPLQINRSTNVKIGYMAGSSTFNGQHASIIRSNTVQIDLDLDSPDITAATGVYLAGGREDSTLAAPISAGDLFFTLATPFTSSVLEGQAFIINGVRYISTAFKEIGCVRMDIQAAPAAASSGATVTSYQPTENVNIRGTLSGFRYGFDVVDASVTLDVLSRRYGEFGMRVRNNASVTATFSTIEGGKGRISNAGLATSDIEIQALGRINHIGGTLGRDTSFVPYNVTLVGSGANRYIGTAVRFANQITGAVSAVDANQYKVYGCTLSDGTLVT